MAPMFDDWKTAYLKWHKAEYPDSHYRVAQIIEDHLMPHFAESRLDAITQDTIESLKAGWRRGFKDHTVTKMLRTTSALFARAVHKKLIETNPAACVTAPKILDAKPHLFYETEDLEALYLAASFDGFHPDDPQHAYWHMPAWKLIANTGMRRGEAMALKRRWVGQDGLKIVSTGEERTKSGEWRDVPLFPGAREALEGLLGDGDYVFPRVSLTQMSRAAGKCIKRAGLEGSLHTLRHTFISHLAKNPDISPRTIQLWAGHASLKTTEKYMYLRAGAGGVNLEL